MGVLQTVLGSYGGSEPLFDPNSIGSVWAWYESSSYALSDGASVTTPWADQSSNARDATVTGVDMTFETNEVNGQPALASANSRFNLPAFTGLTAGEYFAVQKIVSAATSGGHRMAAGTSSHYPFAGDGLIYDTFMTGSRQDGITSSLDMTTWHCVHGWSAANDWAMLQNGTAIRTTGTNAVDAAETIYLLYNGTQYMNAQMAAFYFFSAKLGAENRSGMQSRITAKYGIVFA